MPCGYGRTYVTISQRKQWSQHPLIGTKRRFHENERSPSFEQRHQTTEERDNQFARRTPLSRR